MDTSPTDHIGATSGGINHHHPLPETPGLCSRGCGFFATAENKGLCSKCYYTVYHKDMMIKLEAEAEAEEEAITGKDDDILKDLGFDKLVISTTNNKMRSRCQLCNKKLGLLGFGCKCGGSFCGMHRYPESHPCTFDLMKAGKIAIRLENPVCKHDKIRDRI